MTASDLPANLCEHSCDIFALRSCFISCSTPRSRPHRRLPPAQQPAHVSSGPQNISYVIYPQQGPLKDEDIEALVVQLHKIEVSRISFSFAPVLHVRHLSVFYVAPCCYYGAV